MKRFLQIIGCTALAVAVAVLSEYTKAWLFPATQRGVLLGSSPNEQAVRELALFIVTHAPWVLPGLVLGYLSRRNPIINGIAIGGLTFVIYIVMMGGISRYQNYSLPYGPTVITDALLSFKFFLSFTVSCLLGAALRHGLAGKQGPNNSFKPKPLRSGKGMA